jgi:MerR family transcriptional regulator, light-induced transcriptional regulator
MANKNQEYVLEYLRAVLDKDGVRARRVIDQMLERELGMAEVFGALTDAQFEIGDMWARGVISVADEQFATRTTLDSITRVAEHLRRWRKERRGLALLCTVEGEYHEVGLRMFSELLRDQGWETVLLGTSFSASALVERAKTEGGVDLLCVSATMPSCLPLLIETLREIRAEPVFSRTKILVGGSVFRSKRTRSLLSDGATAERLVDYVSWKQDDALDYTASLKETGQLGLP